jgi:hypothetical protein
VNNGYSGSKEQYAYDCNPENVKKEVENFVLEELTKRGQLKPEFAENQEWLKTNGDQTKLYVLPDGMIYAYMKHESISAGGQPLFTNKAAPTSSDWHTDKRLSLSSGSISDCIGTIVSNAIPMKSGDVIRVKGLRDGTTTTTSSAFVGLIGYSDISGITKAWSSSLAFTKTR